MKINVKNTTPTTIMMAAIQNGEEIHKTPTLYLVPLKQSAPEHLIVAFVRWITKAAKKLFIQK